MTALAPADRRWIFGPAPDLLLGCGVGYALLVALLAVAPIPRVELLAAGLVLSFLVASPHYGATLLRVYEQRSERRKYAFFSVYATLVVAAAFVFGLYELTIGSVLITLYFTWSPWHYTGQNYGIALMFLRRRGVALDLGTKRLVYASFIASFALVFLNLHVAGGPESYGAETMLGTPYRFMRLGIPIGLEGGLIGSTLVVYLATTALAGWRLVRASSRLSDLLPAALLAATQASWFSVPYVYAYWTATTPDSQSVAFLFVWVILGHSVQYLWITTYYAVASRGDAEKPRYLAKALAAGCALWTLPALAFAPSMLGALPYDLGLYLMIAAAVNVHHFILDGAIWKLRDTRVGRVLLASNDDPGGAAEPARAAPAWRPPLAWAAGAAIVVLTIVGAWEKAALARAGSSGDEARADVARARLAAIGRDHPQYRVIAAERLARAGDLDSASREFEASLGLHPTAPGFVGLGLVYELQGSSREALLAYRAALELDPDEPRALHRVGVHLLELGHPGKAEAVLSRAAELLPSDETIRADLARAAASRADPS